MRRHPRAKSGPDQRPTRNRVDQQQAVGVATAPNARRHRGNRNRADTFNTRTHCLER